MEKDSGSASNRRVLGRPRFRLAVAVVAVAVTALAAGTAVVLTRSGEPSGGSPTSAPSPASAEVSSSPASSRVPADRLVTLDAGYAHTCALTSTGVAVCWGDNSQGQVGTGSTERSVRRPAYVAASEPGGRSLSAGQSGACVVTSAGSARCWGTRNRDSNGPGPVMVLGAAAHITAVSVGSTHQCAVTSSGRVTCWGGNSEGQLGDGTTADRVSPVTVRGLPDPASAVAAGDLQTCALTAAGAVLCWGANREGQLGNRGRKRATSAVAVRGLSSGVTAISVGSSHACAVIKDGAVFCWGQGGDGQLGGRTAMISRVPIAVEGLTDAVAVSAGGRHTCAITRTARVLCWGNNGAGQLGDGTRDGRAVPVPVIGLPASVHGIAAGESHTCASTDSGAFCWGDNDNGQLGDGSQEGSLLPIALQPATSLARARDTRPVNVIYVDTGLEPSMEGSREASTQRLALARRLRSQDPALLDAIRLGFVGATAGRISPTGVHVTVAPGVMPLPVVCDGGKGHGFSEEDVERAARPQREKDAINVVVVKALDCPDAEGSQWRSGYDGLDMLPVVLWNALTSVDALVHVLLHEYGHDAGLGHAGIADCEDPVAITHCDLQPTADPDSLMAYDYLDSVFSAPELDALHLLTAGEVVRVTPGQALPLRIVLRNMSQPGPKLIVLREAFGKRSLFLSWEDGILQARYRLTAAESDNLPTGLAHIAGDATLIGRLVFRNPALSVIYVGTDADHNAILDVLPRTGSTTPTPAPTIP